MQGINHNQKRQSLHHSGKQFCHAGQISHRYQFSIGSSKSICDLPCNRPSHNAGIPLLEAIFQNKSYNLKHCRDSLEVQAGRPLQQWGLHLQYSATAKKVNVLPFPVRTADLASPHLGVISVPAPSASKVSSDLADFTLEAEPWEALTYQAYQ